MKVTCADGFGDASLSSSPGEEEGRVRSAKVRDWSCGSQVSHRVEWIASVGLMSLSGDGWYSGHGDG